MAISRMQEPRQMYGLGSLVKKATRAIKKVVKSPVGKAALLAGGAGLLGGVGPFAGLKTSSLGKFLMGAKGPPGLAKTGILQKFFLKNPSTGFSLGNLLGKGLTDRGLAAGIGGLSGLAGLLAAQEAEGEDDISIEDISRGEGLDISDIIRRAKLNDPEFRFLPGAEFTQTYADGGLTSLRSGYAGGQLVGPSIDGSRPGYAGESNIGILDVVKSFPNAVKQIFSGETGSMLGDNQEEKNKFMIQDMFPDMDKETLSMIVDMNNKGADIPTISSITGQDPKIITNMLSLLNMKADGGDVSPMGNPAVVEEIDDMREYRIMNPDVEDVADYLTYYQNLKKEENKKPKKKPRTKKAKGGIMDLDGFEMDLRGGGFVPLGAAEKADDVPARLSKNEFVMTADAVRAAGGGSIDKGADKMYKTMKQLESMV